MRRSSFPLESTAPTGGEKAIQDVADIFRRSCTTVLICDCSRQSMATELTAQQVIWLNAGVENFNAARFWHAHEDWEDLWKSLKGVASRQEVDGVQGIIQIAAMLYNHERHKARGVVSLWHKSSAKLEPVLEGLFGIDIAGLYSQAEPFSSDVETFSMDTSTVKIERQD